MQLDELKIHTNARSPDYFLAQYALEGERNDAVVSYGADETTETAGGGGEAKTHSHFGVIIQNVFGRKEAIVEQVVIGICVLMAAIAIMVMFMKAVYLSRCRRASDRFLGAYRTQATGGGGQLDALVQGDRRYGDSPLFKVYQQGISELRARMSPSVGAAAAGLEEKSLNAIRATLDATMVRENQKLNSLLVLLTIAISGGPFIGLLGTVVGVMVTFAAIAATGDVNIAAIAPGMAAALLATVAGLGVAIPALFGYNYLSSKAKEIAADMHVFADEFIAKVNEVHGV
jgi:biopolymer transport protein ExbB